jgi:DNA-binding transcriptional ArsR family regulator
MFRKKPRHSVELDLPGNRHAGEVCVCDIHDTLGIPQPKASRHLAYLRATGLVVTHPANRVS